MSPWHPEVTTTTRRGRPSWRARLGFLWQSDRSPEAGRQAPLPEPGELVRLQIGQSSTSAITPGGYEHSPELGVYFARVRSVGPHRFVLALEDCAAGESTAGSIRPDHLPDRAVVMVAYDRGDALYQFQTRVVGSSQPSFSVQRPRQVTRVQRRQYYRLPLQSPTTFRTVAADDRPTSEPIAARLVNLSGGGALLACGTPIDAGARALLRVPSGKDGSPLDVAAESLDCLPTAQGRSNSYMIRFRFSGYPGLSQDDRDAIVAYIFEQQRILLRLRHLMRRGA